MAEVVNPQMRQTRHCPQLPPHLVDRRVPSTGPGIHEKTLMTPLGVQPIQHLDGTGVERHRSDPFGLRVQCRDAPHPIAPIDVPPACPECLIETRPCGQQEQRDQTDVAEPRAVLLQHTHQPLQLLGVQVVLHLVVGVEQMDT